MRYTIVALVALAGCQPAARYGPMKITKDDSIVVDAKAAPLPAHYSWMPPADMPDLPIVFVPSTSPEWANLRGFWNHLPPRAAGMRTTHLGLPSLQAAAALVMADHMEVIKLKVPLGLPDPAPHVPAANPLTYGKWRLGRKIFYDQILDGDTGRLACASCHQPLHGFAQESACTLRGARNTLSLLNVVYNKQQFWDGRVDVLEQVVVRSLEDERPRAERSVAPEISHIWGGLAKKLGDNPDYADQFKMVFGIRQATQDSIAKALASYLRTLLSGNSLFDKANQERARTGDTVLTARHFTPFLDDATLVGLERTGDKADQVAEALARGYRLFHGAARCVRCHQGPLFTDQGYHNTGWGKSEQYLVNSREGGRFAALPVGLKEAKFIGAYRTPTLRNLPRTAPYFHDGGQPTINQVLQYYDHFVWADPYLDPALRVGAETQALKLTTEDFRNLAVFLRSLNGNPIDPILTGGG